MTKFLRKVIFIPIVIVIFLILGVLIGAIWQYSEIDKEHLKEYLREYFRKIGINIPEKDSVQETITILSPMKGEVWRAGETYQIRWSPCNPTKKVEIILIDRIKGEGASWQKELIPDTGSYFFTVPDILEGDEYQFYISSKEKYGYTNLFTISAETTGWKTYRSPKMGLSMKYPGEAEIEIENPEGEPLATVSLHYLDSSGYSSGVFVIRKDNYDNKLRRSLSIGEIQDKVLPAILGVEVKEQKEEWIFIDNNQAIKFSWFSKEEAQLYDVSVVIVGRYIFIIGCFSEQEWCKDNFDLILSTVIFEKEIKLGKSCWDSEDCGVCQMCSTNGICLGVDTDWGDGLYGCETGEGLAKKRCYQGICRICEGLLRYDPGAKKFGCWYLGTPATSCKNFCGEKGCFEDSWTDDNICSTGRALTNCDSCSTEYENGWWVPYYNIPKNTCYHNQGVGTRYSCYWGPNTANIQRICACNY